VKSYSGVNDGNGVVSLETSKTTGITKYSATSEALSPLHLGQNKTNKAGCVVPEY